ncbi:MAG: hypothetical protein ACI9JR_003164, partial [Gammaproteobacteria bacterium]
KDIPQLLKKLRLFYTENNLSPLKTRRITLLFLAMYVQLPV